mgnify:CR=1 FL=1
MRRPRTMPGKRWKLRSRRRRILASIRDGACVIALAIEGKMLDSVELSEKIASLGVSGTSQIVFVIGGSLGLSKRVLDRADYLLSFSRMTFPHQLMRVILLEQIYRGYRIMNGEPYHKWRVACKKMFPMGGGVGYIYIDLLQNIL